MDTYIMTSDTMEAVSLVAAQTEPRLSREEPLTETSATFLLSKTDQAEMWSVHASADPSAEPAVTDV